MDERVEVLRIPDSVYQRDDITTLPGLGILLDDGFSIFASARRGIRDER